MRRRRPHLDGLGLVDYVSVMAGSGWAEGVSIPALHHPRACLAGEDDGCDRARALGVHRPGGMAEYVAVPARNAVVLPASVPFAMPTTAGSYEFRLFGSNGFTRLATSGPVAVSVAPAPPEVRPTAQEPATP